MDGSRGPIFRRCSTRRICSQRTGLPSNRCIWHVMNLLWVPAEQREERREQLLEIAENDHFPYFLALEQDYEQMARQQVGLRNSTLTELALTRQEVRLAHYHSALDSWVKSGANRIEGGR
jgi:hypothetical protein